MSTATTQPVAIVGMACHLPGASDLAAYWELLRGGKAVARKLPDDRFDRRTYFAPEGQALGKSYVDIGCLIDYPPIDELRAKLPFAAASQPEIAFLMLADVARQAARQAKLDPDRMPELNAAVLVAHARDSGLGGDLAYSSYIPQIVRYLDQVEALSLLSPQQKSGFIDELTAEVMQHYARRSAENNPTLGAAMAAQCVARALGLDGPQFSLNAACASSLAGLYYGVRALQQGRVNMAVVGGASYLHTETLVLFSRAQSLSKRASCPFDASADGLVVGEGYVAVILMRLDDAIEQGIPVQAIVRGAGMSTDGRGRSLWAPKAEGQILAIQRAYRDSRRFSDVQYVEAHATSTRLGDATELRAMVEAVGPAPRRENPILLGSVKGNIGHTLEAAGLAGLIKVVLSMQHEHIPPSVGIAELNPEIAWDEAPFEVARSGRSWSPPPDDRPRCAGVSSFGIGGLNVHVALEEYSPPSKHIARSRERSRGVRIIDQGAAPKPRLEVPHEPVAVVGMGLVAPGAFSLDEFWQQLKSQRDLTQPATGSLENGEGRLGGWVKGFEYDWRRHKIPPKQLQYANPLQFMVLSAVEQALGHAGLLNDKSGRLKTGVVVGTSFGGEYANQLKVMLRLPEFTNYLRDNLLRKNVNEATICQIIEQYTANLMQRIPALLDETGSFSASSLASRITKTFDILGGAVAVDSGNSSSLSALMFAVDMLRSGDCDTVICIGAHQDMSPARYELLSYRGQLATSRPLSSSDSRSDGIVPGEGCAAVVLQRQSTALEANRRALGLILGVGAADAICPHEASRLAALRAREESGISGKEVDFVEVSGNGIAELDSLELAGLAAAYCRSNCRRTLQVGSLVPQIGHLGPASGILSLVKAILALDHHAIPATLESRSTNFQLPTHAFGPVISFCSEQTPLSTEDDRTFAAVHTQGDGASAYHAIIERGQRFTKPPTRGATKMNNNGKSQNVPIRWFDATERRRSMMARKAAGKGPIAPADLPEEPHNNLASRTSEDVEHLAPSRNGAQNLGTAAAASPQPGSDRPSSTGRRGVKGSARPEEYEAFLVNFVVEQTGYPEEIVELDADLEADLGIDSIKKAQLFGELREYFNVQADESLSFDDFTTLRHILDYLVQDVPAAVSPKPPAPASPPAAASPPALVSSPAPALPSWSSQPRIVTEQLHADGRSPDEFKSFLVNFVVEQTGYPEEIVELDADLEADLGIDSIKKAQLFGELREYFGVQADESLSFDDFTTLRHILDYLLPARLTSANSANPPASASAPASLPSPSTPSASPPHSATEQPRADGPSAEELKSFLVNFVVEQTGYPEDIVEMDADLEADLGIDSIKKAQLFGELREYFGVQADENLSFDDFTTLGHIFEYVALQFDSSSNHSVMARRPK